MKYINKNTGDVIPEEIYNDLSSYGKSKYRPIKKVSSSGDFLLSAAIGAATGSALLGGLIGGDIVGGIAGDLLDGDLMD